jgi:ATP-dependent DNA helicase DinG
LRKSGICSVEAGTGTAKPSPYLIPGHYGSARQKEAHRHFDRDKEPAGTVDGKGHTVPAKGPAEKVLRAYMKGRSNYACLYRIHKADGQPILDGLDQLGHFDRVAAWSRETRTGDRRELVDLPEDLSFWSRINAKGDTCIGQKCPDFEPCFITRMRANAEDADIIVVNHHLFFADLSVRGNQFGRVIPDYAAGDL